MECTKCGAYIKGSDNFCSYCGNKIEKTIPLMIPHDKRNYEPLENICQGIIDEIKEGTWNSDNDDEHLPGSSSGNLAPILNN